MSKALIVATTTGSSTTSFAQRPLTTIKYQINPDGTAATFVTLAANRFTLAAGTYRISGRAKVCGAAADNAGIRLYNFTDSAAVVDTEDAMQIAIASENVDCYFDCAFTLAGSKVFELQGKASAAFATNGYGITIGGFTTYFAQIEILKTA